MNFHDLKDIVMIYSSQSRDSFDWDRAKLVLYSPEDKKSYELTFIGSSRDDGGSIHFILNSIPPMKHKLPNRDGAELSFVMLNDSWGYLEVDKKHSYILDYARVEYDKSKDTPTAYDPSGGPFITKGYKITDKLSVNGILFDHELNKYLFNVCFTD